MHNVGRNISPMQTEIHPKTHTALQVNFPHLLTDRN